MRTQIRFSIVTPSYNQAHYLGTTIESVLQQEGDFEIEYFVIDGGSTDGSVELLQRYAAQLANGSLQVRCAGVQLMWVSERDNGQSDAINRGMRQASGDILSYINSDDAYLPRAFDRVATAFREYTQANFIYGDGDVIDELGQLQWEWLSRSYNQKVMTSYHMLWNDFTNYIMQQATFWRRGVLDQIGYFDETFHYAMDVEYWVRAGAAGLKLQHIPCKLGAFRLIQGTKSLSSPTAFWEDYLEIFRRYRGARSMKRFFAFYYYNLIRSTDDTIGEAIAAGGRVFKRWHYLSHDEREILKQQAAAGATLACFLSAHYWYRQGRSKEAAEAYQLGVTRQNLAALHPMALSYQLLQWLGPRRTADIDRGAQRAISAYRWRRYQYRYGQPHTAIKQ